MNKLIAHTYFPFFLLAVSLLLALNCLRFMVQAVDSYQGYHELQTRVNMLKHADDRLHAQTLQLKQLALRAQQMRSPSVKIEGHLDFVGYLEDVCQQQGVKIISHPQESSEQVADFSLADERFSLQGKLPALLKVIYQLEYQDRVGTIVYSSLVRELVGFGGSRKQLLLAHIQLKRLAG